MKILAFAGSLRKGSFNKALLRTATTEVPEGMEIEIFDLEGIPLFNADVEAEGDPVRVCEFKEAIRETDGVLIASPEYNHGITGITKNAIDWASRSGKDAPLYGKPVGIVGASPGVTGTARSQDQLRQSLKSINAYCMPQPEFLVFRAREKFDEKGILVDESTRNFLKKYLNSLADWVKTFQ